MRLAQYQRKEPYKFLVQSGLEAYYVYHIWSQRNSRIRRGEVKTEEIIAKCVKKDAKFRVMSKKKWPQLYPKQSSVITGLYLIPSFMTFA